MTDNKTLWIAAGVLTLIGVYMYTRPKETAATVSAPVKTTAPSSASTAASSPPSAVVATETKPDAPLGTPEPAAPASPQYVVKTLDLSAPVSVAGIGIETPAKATTDGYLTFEQAAAVKPATFSDWQKLTQAPIGAFPTGCSPVGGSGVISWQGNEYPFSDCIPTYVLYLPSYNAYTAYKSVTPGVDGSGIPKPRGNQVVLIV